MLTWVEPKIVHSNTDKTRIAAVHIETDQIANIYANCVDAARKVIIEKYFTFTPSMTLIMDAAKQIASAANSYHVEVLGYYWKYIS